MSKMIIENRSELDDNVALQLVKQVIEQGRISNYGNNTVMLLHLV